VQRDSQIQIKGRRGKPRLREGGSKLPNSKMIREQRSFYAYADGLPTCENQIPSSG
jgi:hypothetical protein